MLASQHSHLERDILATNRKSKTKLVVWASIMGGASGCGYGNLKMTIIEQVEQGNGDLLSKREIYWQNQLRCFVENGGQAQCKRKEK